LDTASKVAVERIFVELTKLLTGQDAPKGLMALAEYGLLEKCLPELCPAIGCGQNTHHAFDVWSHTLEVVRLAPPDPAMRWAALLHDVGKPAAKFIDQDGRAKFHGHEAMGVETSSKIFNRRKASNALQVEALALIKHHGVWSEQSWSDAACRRLLHRLADDGLDWRRWAALQLADQLGKGKDTQSAPQVNARLIERMERLSSETPPLNVKALAIDGNRLMALAARPGGPWLGALQRHLLEAVLDEPCLNSPDTLEPLAAKWLCEEQEKGNRG
jgi:putative nucleotidyltransferase with HDIG domain